MAERTCIVTRQVCDPGALIRFARSPDGIAVPDIRCKLPGRGAWISLRRPHVETAVEKNLFSRAFKQQTTAPADLADQVDKLLADQALGYLSLAAKAGELVRGFDKVEAVLLKDKADVLIAARDGSSDGRNKLKAKLKGDGRTAELVEVFACDELGLALGRTNVIHAALTKGGLAKKFVASARRLETYRFLQDDERKFEERA